jgi:hypothetical protein
MQDARDGDGLVVHSVVDDVLANQATPQAGGKLVAGAATLWVGQELVHRSCKLLGLLPLALAPSLARVPQDGALVDPRLGGEP